MVSGLPRYEAAATLIAAGATLDITNSRGWMAADFAEGHLLPKFLKQGLAGEREECKKVSSLALSNCYFSV